MAWNNGDDAVAFAFCEVVAGAPVPGCAPDCVGAAFPVLAVVAVGLAADGAVAVALEFVAVGATVPA